MNSNFLERQHRVTTTDGNGKYTYKNLTQMNYRCMWIVDKKPNCHIQFTQLFSTFCCVFLVITLVDSIKVGNRKTQRTAENACLNAPFLYIFKQMTSKKCLFTFYQIYQNIVIKILLVWQKPSLRLIFLSAFASSLPFIHSN